MSKKALTLIAQEKKDLLYLSYVCLIIHPDSIKQVYLKLGQSDFKSFLESIRQDHFIGRSEFKLFLESQGIHYDITLPLLYSFPSEMIQAAKLSMRQPGYEPPADCLDKLLHLTAMWQLYSETPSWPPSTGALWLDLSFAKLLASAHRMLGEIDYQGGLKYRKAKNLLDKVSAKTDLRKMRVLRLYAWFKKLEPNISRNVAAKKIHDELKNELDIKEKNGEEVEFKLPAIRTIQRYLKEEQSVKRSV